ncbi:hypothetical protein D3C71_1841400 [compost metagenome]
MNEAVDEGEQQDRNVKQNGHEAGAKGPCAPPENVDYARQKADCPKKKSGKQKP